MATDHGATPYKHICEPQSCPGQPLLWLSASTPVPCATYLHKMAHLYTVRPSHIQHFPCVLIMYVQLAIVAVSKAPTTWPLDAAHKLVHVGVVHLQQWKASYVSQDAVQATSTHAGYATSGHHVCEQSLGDPTPRSEYRACAAGAAAYLDADLVCPDQCAAVPVDSTYGALTLVQHMVTATQPTLHTETHSNQPTATNVLAKACMAAEQGCLAQGADTCMEALPVYEVHNCGKSTARLQIPPTCRGRVHCTEASWRPCCAAGACWSVVCALPVS